MNATATQQAPGKETDQSVRDELVAVQEQLRLARVDAEITFGPEGMTCKNMAALWRLAMIYSRSRLVPEQFQGKPEDCCIALQMAIRLKVDPFMFMQACYVVHGRPGVESKLAIALANNAGVFRDRIKFQLEGSGASRCCTAYAHDAVTGDRCEQKVTMAMAVAEKWVSKAGSKWQTMPDLMLQYRSAMFLIRLSCPEVLMGMQSVEELTDLPPTSTGAQSPSSIAELTERLMAVPAAPEAKPEESTEVIEDDAEDGFAFDAEDESEPACDLDAIAVELRACPTDVGCRAIYNRLCGPDSELNEAQRESVAKLVIERREVLKQARAGKETQGDLLDKGSPSAVGA